MQVETHIWTKCTNSNNSTISKDIHKLTTTEICLTSKVQAGVISKLNRIPISNQRTQPWVSLKTSSLTAATQVRRKGVVSRTQREASRTSSIQESTHLVQGTNHHRTYLKNWIQVNNQSRVVGTPSSWDSSSMEWKTIFRNILYIRDRERSRSREWEWVVENNSNRWIKATICSRIEKEWETRIMKALENQVESINLMQGMKKITVNRSLNS
jgi:hypothetical protein